MHGHLNVRKQYKGRSCENTNYSPTNYRDLYHAWNEQTRKLNDLQLGDKVNAVRFARNKI